MVIRVSLLILPIVCADVYQPGTPGAPWSEEEMLIVKAKMQDIFRRGGGFDAVRTIRPDHSGRWSRIPDAPKFLRLGFHDCLK